MCPFLCSRHCTENKSKLKQAKSKVLRKAIYLYYMQFGERVSFNVYFLKVCPDCTSPCNISVVNIGMYVRAIQ